VVHDQRPVKFLFHLLLLLALSALTGAAWVAHRPAVLQASAALKEGTKPRDLVDDLKQAAIKGSGIVEISEAELNRHLSKVLTARMKAPLDQWASFDHLHLDLKTDVASATLAWKVAGHLSTVTVDLSVARLDKVFRIEVVGGAYGHLQVPRGLLRPLAPALNGLSMALEEEIQALFQMNQVRVAEDKLVLDPRFP
jgi:hypothetical protein